MRFLPGVSKGITIPTPSTDISGHFEVHLTVTLAAGRETAFCHHCRQHGLKPLHIVLARGVAVSQPMATFRRQGNLAEVHHAADEATARLQTAGFTVTRIKLEVEPTAAGVPQNEAEVQQQPADRYFEHHVKLALPSDDVPAQLVALCERHGGHISRNALASFSRVSFPRFVTVRHYGVHCAASEQLRDALLADLQSAGYEVLKVESEYCVADNNLALDDGWLPQEPQT